MKNSYNLRRAHPEEAEVLTQLAFRSKAYWGYPPEWIQAWKDQLTVTPEYITTSMAFVVEHEGRAVAFWCRSAIESQEPSKGLLFVDPDHIGCGCGRLLFEAIKAECLQRGIHYFTLEADPHAAPFYMKLGAHQVGEIESSVIPGRTLPILRFDFRNL